MLTFMHSFEVDDAIRKSNGNENIIPNKQQLERKELGY